MWVSRAGRLARSALIYRSGLCIDSRTPRAVQPSHLQYRLFVKSSRPAQTVPDFAFAFDIDGVLLRSSKPISGASESLRFLQRNKIPFICLTNGGGQTEATRIATLNEKLDVKLDESMIVQSHTPFASYEALKDKCVLVMGGDAGKCRDVAELYGFTHAITSGDIYAAHPEIWPFSRVFSEYYKEWTRPLRKLINAEKPEDSLKIDAVFVFNDPRDWALELQVLLDICLSREGIMGTYSDKNGDRKLKNNGYLQEGQPPIFFSNPDLLWAASYHLSRLGQGGFRVAFEGLWSAVTGGEREGVDLTTMTVIGKPFRETYEFAERRLVEHRDNVLGAEAKSLRRVYMIGDNPESDIRGAETFESPRGVEWKSLLVKTGVYKEGKDPSWAPREIVSDVNAAVQWALRDSKWEGPDFD